MFVGVLNIMKLIHLSLSSLSCECATTEYWPGKNGRTYTSLSKDTGEGVGADLCTFVFGGVMSAQIAFPFLVHF